MPELLRALHKKFGESLQDLNFEVEKILDEIATDLRKLANLADVLDSDFSGGELHRLGGSSLLREAFSDLSQAMYLHCVGLIVPGRMSTRRAFELGIASVYIWDLPHAYWGWLKCDTDLSFSDMINHLSSVSYIELLRSQHIEVNNISIFVKECHKTYRILSNTVHGKHNDLPMLSPQRFQAEKAKIIAELALIKIVSNVVIEAWKARLPTCCDT